jgi:ATP-dependent protease ClpP protease subunit
MRPTANFQAFAKSHPGELRVYVDSPGGDIDSAARIAEVMRGRNARCTGRQVASSAAYLWIVGCGSKYITEDGHVLIHHSRLYLPGGSIMTPEQLQQQARTLADLDRALDAEMARGIGMDLDAFRAHVANGAEWRLGPAAAVEAGMADAVVSRE